MLVDINAFSFGEANIFTHTCCGPANINHSHIPHDTSLLCSASDNHNKSFKDFIEVVDCFKSICNAEFDIIGFQYSLFTKSSISCDIVVIPTQYFLALFIKPNKNSAEVLCFNIIQASSQTNILFFLCDLTFVRIKFKTLNIAGVFNTSSRSLILNTVILLFISTLV